MLVCVDVSWCVLINVLVCVVVCVDVYGGKTSNSCHVTVEGGREDAINQSPFRNEGSTIKSP